MLLVHLLLGCAPDPAAPDNRAEAPAAQATDAAGNSARAAPAGPERLVVALGDSLYAGYNLEPGDGFAPELEDALEDRGIAARVIDGGVSGDTSAAGRARLAYLLDGLPRKPDLVIIGLGGNDMLRGLSPETTRDNLDAMLAELKRRGVPAMLTGMVAAPNLGRDYGGRFDAIYPDLARKYGVPLYPFFLDGVFGDRAFMLPDGIHPNAEGVERVVEKVEPIVAAALGAPAAASR